VLSAVIGELDARDPSVEPSNVHAGYAFRSRPADSWRRTWQRARPAEPFDASAVLAAAAAALQSDHAALVRSAVVRDGRVLLQVQPPALEALESRLEDEDAAQLTSDVDAARHGARALNPYQQRRAEQVLEAIGRAAEACVAPRLRERVRVEMETFQRDVVQVCPSPDDELAFAAYAITLHDHFIGGRGSAYLAGAKQCNISSVRAERVRYLARPDWERTAALYTNFAQAAAIGVQHWDLTALCACIENCAAFKCCPGAPPALTRARRAACGCSTQTCATCATASPTRTPSTRTTTPPWT